MGVVAVVVVVVVPVTASDSGSAVSGCWGSGVVA